MRTNIAKEPQPIYLKDYCVPDYLIEKIDLTVELTEQNSLVVSQLHVNRNTISGDHTRPLVLDGQEQQLEQIRINDNVLLSNQYTVTDSSLTIHDVPESFILEIKTIILPQKNTTLSGLYKSNGMYCTQCEAQGFRRITYYLDRPDVMALFSTTIVADLKAYPVLLSNGNKVASGKFDDGRHWVKFDDPFKKPCYLFALVAGDLECVKDTFITKSNRKVDLEIYVEQENADKCSHAISSLKKAMKWDEDTYGLEYDLDVYMIVAVNDFNMGAMENKGLNIFNSKYVLATNKTATDGDFENVEAVIGHEYFHNWSGNRVTCRDWFQLSLKEGLTVFREQQFTEDTASKVIKRIDQVNVITTKQFAEDSSPMAHPVQPESFIEINNFYTLTVYYKGAEVIRMLHTLVGQQGFRKGLDLYFQRHDGQAVIIESFVAAMEDANSIDLTQFKRWYTQAGTPVVTAKASFDVKTKKYNLTLSQQCNNTPGLDNEKPFYIPVKLGLYSKQGEKLSPKTQDAFWQNDDSVLLVLNEKEQTFSFDYVSQLPIPSILGDFSAPVKLDYPYTDEELAILIAHDSDQFNRWNACQKLATNVVLQAMDDQQNGKPTNVSDYLFQALDKLLNDQNPDEALLARLLTLPSFDYIAQQLPSIHVNELHTARSFVRLSIANKFIKDFERLYKSCAQRDKGELTTEQISIRALKNCCLGYLVGTSKKEMIELAKLQFEQSRNMTDEMGSLMAINDLEGDVRNDLLERFYKKWQSYPLVVNKWLTLQAVAKIDGALDNVVSLMSRDAFNVSNPNNVYALIGSFTSQNPTGFHLKSGKGYQFLANLVVKLNDFNPQVAARIVNPLICWQRYDSEYRENMKKALQLIQSHKGLSPDVFEIVNKSLKE